VPATSPTPAPATTPTPAPATPSATPTPDETNLPPSPGASRETGAAGHLVLANQPAGGPGSAPPGGEQIAPSPAVRDPWAGNGSSPTVRSSGDESRIARGPQGIGLQAGGGVVSFARREMRDVARAGGYWDVRVALGLRQVAALELAYVGAAHSLDPFAAGAGAALVGHGLEGALRLNVPLTLAGKGKNGVFLVPYGLAGLGWMHYHTTGGANDGTVLAQSDGVATIPLGGGVSVGRGHLYLDTRFTYRLTTYEDLVVEGSGSHLRHWTYGGSVGYMF
jgi:hypothetical protein